MDSEIQGDREAEVLREGFRKSINPPKAKEVERAFTFLPDPHDPEGRTDFRKFLDEAYDGTMHELFTEEYIAGLGEYLTQRIHELGKTSDEPVRIVEVAARHGRLSGYLRSYLEKKPEMNGKFSIIATDIIGKSDKDASDPFPVEEEEYDSALIKYDPQIVLGSWLPLDTMRINPLGKSLVTEDWSKEFRKRPNLKEYILIGDQEVTASKGTFGRNRTLWPFSKPEYEREGFHKNELKELNQWQYAINSTKKNLHPSTTVSFQRKAKG